MNAAKRDLAYPLPTLPFDVIADSENHEVEVYTLVVDARGRCVADCGVLGWSTDDQEAVAAAIVAAVNAVPELRAENDRLRAALDSIIEGAPDEEPAYDDWGGDTERAESYGGAQEHWRCAQIARKEKSGDPNKEEAPMSPEDAREIIMHEHDHDSDAAIAAIAERYNCREVSVDQVGDVWIADPQTGHWLDEDALIELVTWGGQNHGWDTEYRVT